MLDTGSCVFINQQLIYNTAAGPTSENNNTIKREILYIMNISFSIAYNAE
jgi:hypothetical protein